MLTIRKKPGSGLNLFIVHETMLIRRTIECGRDGIRALKRLKELDRDHLTRSVGLYNRVQNPTTRAVENVPVWLSIDTLPRWMTAARKIAERRANGTVVRDAPDLP